MSMPADTRQRMLARIAAQLGRAGTQPSQADADAEWQRIARGYTRTSSAERADVISLFIERLRDYDATVQRIERTSVGEVVSRVLANSAFGSAIAAHGFAAIWPECAGLDLAEDDGLSSLALDRFKRVITAATLGIAETGSIVLQNVAGQGRRATSLIPDVHLCLLRTADIVATVPEAFDRLRATSRLPTTVISGPSATADIEMTRIKGVHGPRSLHVLLIDDAPGSSIETR